MEMKTFVIHHLVKSEELNHHGTLFAGRSAEWFVESGFIAAASLTRPDHVVCVKIHGMTFKKPVPLGKIVRFESRIVLAGRSRLVANIRAYVDDEIMSGGFITFVHVDEAGHAIPHGITIEPRNDEERAIQEEAEKL